MLWSLASSLDSNKAWQEYLQRINFAFQGEELVERTALLEDDGSEDEFDPADSKEHEPASKSSRSKHAAIEEEMHGIQSSDIPPSILRVLLTLRSAGGLQNSMETRVGLLKAHHHTFSGLDGSQAIPLCKACPADNHTGKCIVAQFQALNAVCQAMKATSLAEQ